MSGASSPSSSGGGGADNILAKNSRSREALLGSQVRTVVRQRERASERGLPPTALSFPLLGAIGRLAAGAIYYSALEEATTSF